MYESLVDILRTLTKSSLDTQPLRELRGRVWLGQALHLCGLNLQEFTRVHIVRNRTRSNLVQKWENGDVAPSKHTVAAVERSLPGSRWIYDLPLWELLRNEPISKQRLRGITASLTTTLGLQLWWFPGDDARFAQRKVPIAIYPDTDRLVARNDIWGLVGCVLRTRLCEQDRAEGEHLNESMNMFRAMPGALKLPGFRPYAEELLSSLMALRSRVLLTALLYDVDLDVILRQADDPLHQPWRELRGRDPQTHRCVDIEDPILFAEIISGRGVRARVSKAEARRAKKRSHTPSQITEQLDPRLSQPERRSR